MSEDMTRRGVLRQGVSVSVGAAVALVLGGCGADDARTIACSNPDTLSRGELSMRESLGYAAPSEMPGKTCSDCAYFAADESGTGCGQCQILGGPVSSQGHCNSWSQQS